MTKRHKKKRRTHRRYELTIDNRRTAEVWLLRSLRRHGPATQLTNADARTAIRLEQLGVATIGSTTFHYRTVQDVRITKAGLDFLDALDVHASFEAAQYKLRVPLHDE